MPEQRLTQSNLNQLTLFTNSGDAVGYYSYLENLGFRYATLAKGVVLGDNPDGAASRRYAENVGKITVDKTSISGEEWATITNQLMLRDIGARTTLFNTPNAGVDLSYQIVRDYHAAVFAGVGLRPQAWTIYVPIETTASSEADKQAMWDDVLDSVNLSDVDKWFFAFGVGAITIGDYYDSDNPGANNDQALWIQAMLFGEKNDGSLSNGAIQAYIQGYADIEPYIIPTEDGGVLMGGTQGADSLVNAENKPTVMIGYGGNDFLYANDQNDTIRGNGGDDYAKGFKGNDKLYGDIGNDTLDGGENDDTLDGGAGSDSLVGGDGKDTFITDGVGNGRDTVDAGEGEDIIDLAGTDPVTVYMGTGNDMLINAPLGSIIEGGEGSDTFGLGKNILIADASTEDAFRYLDFTLTGGIRNKASELPWSNGKYGVQYAKNTDNELVIKSPVMLDSKWTYVANYGATLDSPMPGNILLVEMLNTAYRLLETPNGWQFESTMKNLLGYALKAMTGKSYYKGVDPLVLDVDGDGFELTAQTMVSPLFDIDKDRFAEHTGWVRGDDAFLVRDLNANGKIDDVGEMFGNATTSGFAALAALDSNRQLQMSYI